MTKAIGALQHAAQTEGWSEDNFKDEMVWHTTNAICRL
jgi:hypothetical protein